jgi:hypothetical protein
LIVAVSRGWASVAGAVAPAMGKAWRAARRVRAPDFAFYSCMPYWLEQGGACRQVRTLIFRAAAPMLQRYYLQL